MGTERNPHDCVKMTPGTGSGGVEVTVRIEPEDLEAMLGKIFIDVPPEEGGLERAGKRLSEGLCSSPDLRFALADCLAAVALEAFPPRETPRIQAAIMTEGEDENPFHFIDVGAWIRYAPDADLMDTALNGWEISPDSPFWKWTLAEHVLDPDLERILDRQEFMSGGASFIPLRKSYDPRDPVDREDSATKAVKWLAVNRMELFIQMVLSGSLRNSDIEKADYALLEVMKNDEASAIAKRIVSITDRVESGEAHRLEALTLSMTRAAALTAASSPETDDFERQVL